MTLKNIDFLCPEYSNRSERDFQIIIWDQARADVQNMILNIVDCDPSGFRQASYATTALITSVESNLGNIPSDEVPDAMLILNRMKEIKKALREEALTRGYTFYDLP